MIIIESKLFYWQPQIWGPRGTVQPFKHSSSSMFDIIIYVNSKDSFKAELPKLDPAWKNTKNSKDITLVKFDATDPYFASLAAAYVLSYKFGMSYEHLEWNVKTPRIITSITRYFFYYHMSRFLRDSSKIILSPDEITLLRKNIPTKKIWTNKYHHGRETPSYWWKHNPNRHNICHVRADMAGNGHFGGQLGIKYQEVTSITNASDDERFKKSNAYEKAMKQYNEDIRDSVFARDGISITESYTPFSSFLIRLIFDVCTIPDHLKDYNVDEICSNSIRLLWSRLGNYREQILEKDDTEAYKVKVFRTYKKILDEILSS